jgi:hypothetical protein
MDASERRSFLAYFDDDPVGAVLSVLADEGGATGLSAEQIKQALLQRGVPAEALLAWRRIQARLATQERVSVGGDRYRRTYRYLEHTPTPAQALALLEEQRLPAGRRAALVQIVRSALGPAAASPNGHGRGADDRGRLARLEQREKDAVRALAEMAIEIEELAVNEASTRAVVHTVRALTTTAQLSPIEAAGHTTRFDRTQHASVGGHVADGAPVLVIRPGYVWHRPDGDILIAKAVVQDRSKS